MHDLPALLSTSSLTGCADLHVLREICIVTTSSKQLHDACLRQCSSSVACPTKIKNFIIICKKWTLQVDRATLEKLSDMHIAWVCFHFSWDTPHWSYALPSPFLEYLTMEVNGTMKHIASCFGIYLFWRWMFYDTVIRPSSAENSLQRSYYHESANGRHGGSEWTPHWYIWISNALSCSQTYYVSN